MKTKQIKWYKVTYFTTNPEKLHPKFDNGLFIDQYTVTEVTNNCDISSNNPFNPSLTNTTNKSLLGTSKMIIKKGKPTII